MKKEDVTRIEAILYAAGDRISVQRMSELTGISHNTVMDILESLEQRYNTDDTTALFLTTVGDDFKLTVKKEFLGLVEQIAPDTELSKAVIETLSVLAWKNPVMQSDIVKLKSAKVYDHIAELKERGFVVKEKVGRSFVLKLTPKFYSYFDVSGKDMDNAFNKFKYSDLISQKKVEDFPQAQKPVEEKVEEEPEVEEELQGPSIPEIKAEEKKTQKDFFDKLETGLQAVHDNSKDVRDEFSALVKKDQDQAEEDPTALEE
ncbi:MAG: segregation and condensation protein B [Candidatus Woesearchaeota archaeon]|jgi:segregation and condensation protein B